MKSTVRRATAMAAASFLVATGALMAPSAATAVVVLPAPEDVSGYAYYDGEGVGYYLDFYAAPSTHDEGVTLLGYEGAVYTGAPTYTTLVAKSSTTSLASGGFSYTGLTIDTLYQGAVRAVYTVDNGDDDDTTEFSSWVSAAPSKALKPAPKPLSLNARASGPGKVTVSWRVPSVPAQTDTIAGFSVQASPELDFDDIIDPNYQFEMVGKSADADQTSVTLTKLRPGVTYDISVSTVSESSAFGFGDSAMTSVKVLGAPAKPTGLKVKTLSGQSSKLTWKGAKATGAAPVDGYRVYVNGKLKKTVGKSARSFVAKGQKDGKRYTYVVKSYNKVASSAPASVTKKRPTD